MKRVFSKLFKLSDVSASVQPDNNKLQSYSNTKSIRKQLVAKELAKAIENEDFEIYYQPQVNTEGIIYGAEALLRWNHHKLGFISPGEFIPIAEETEAIHQLSDWVIKKVCLQIRIWEQKGLAVQSVSINISPVRLKDNGIVEFVKQQLEIYGVLSTHLEFEITENSLLKFDKNILSTIKELKEYGIRIAIDDFGIGHSSIELLREFHADTLKIDQLFIKNMSNANEKDKVIISSILHLAKGLDMRIVAEGVEEYDQFNFLKQEECGYIQGYLFSKPVSAEMYEKLMRIGYIKPIKDDVQPEYDGRRYYRFDFPFPVLGEMTIIEVNKRRVNVGASEILIKDLSLGGVKVQSTLKLPVNVDFKFKFKFTMMGEQFALKGTLRWKDDAKRDTYHYGVAYELSQVDERRLASLINKMTVLRNRDQEIPGTRFVYNESLLIS